MVSANFVGHTDRVTCCAIVSKGGLLVSCSEDNTVKVSVGSCVIKVSSSACMSPMDVQVTVDIQDHLP